MLTAQAPQISQRAAALHRARLASSVSLAQPACCSMLSAALLAAPSTSPMLTAQAPISSQRAASLNGAWLPDLPLLGNPSLSLLSDSLSIFCAPRLNNNLAIWCPTHAHLLEIERVLTQIETTFHLLTTFVQVQN